MNLFWHFLRLLSLRFSISTLMAFVTSAVWSILFYSILYLLEDVFVTWKNCSLLLLLHVSMKNIIGALPDLSWRKPVCNGTWKSFTSICFICVNSLIKPSTFTLWYRLYWFKMVLISIISICKHLPKSSSIFLILSYLSYLIDKFLKYLAEIFKEENCLLFTIFCLYIYVLVRPFLFATLNWWKRWQQIP